MSKSYELGSPRLRQILQAQFELNSDSLIVVYISYAKNNMNDKYRKMLFFPC